MARATTMQRFARWHIWLGWLAGFPILMWTVTGLFMAARPISEVRGDHLLARPDTVATDALVIPPRLGKVKEMTLAAQADGPVWIVTQTDGARYRYSARDGTVLGPVTKDEARAIADQAYIGTATLEGVTYFPGDVAPSDLRQPIDSWQARFSDGTHLYIADVTGEVVAVRTGFWRAYDFMWGLHIMDLKTRENAHHAILLIFAGISVAGALLGCILMFRRRKARVKAS